MTFGPPQNHDRPLFVNQHQDLPRWLWLYFPPALALLLLVSMFVAPDFAYMIIRQDHDNAGGGLAEHGTVAVLLPGFVLGCLAAKRVYRQDAWLAAWLATWALGALYFALEEASWGQWYFGWDSPEYFLEHNKQKETNLHNTFPWLNRLPRRLLELWIVVMGFIGPLVMLIRKKPWFEGRIWWAFPTLVCLPTATIYLAIRIARWFPAQHFRSVELREYYIGLFVTIFIASLWWRTRHRPGDQG